jgi:NADH dehydrogenase
MGAYAACSIVDDLSGREREALHCADRSEMTIGARRAVARIAWPFQAQLSGTSAWLAWLFIHLIFFTGADRRASVLLTWIYSYVTKTTRSRKIASIDEKIPIQPTVESKRFCL